MDPQIVKLSQKGYKRLTIVRMEHRNHVSYQHSNCHVIINPKIDAIRISAPQSQENACQSEELEGEKPPKVVSSRSYRCAAGLCLNSLNRFGNISTSERWTGRASVPRASITEHSVATHIDADVAKVWSLQIHVVFVATLQGDSGRTVAMHWSYMDNPRSAHIPELSNPHQRCWQLDLHHK